MITKSNFCWSRSLNQVIKRLGSRSILDLSHKRFGSGLILEPSYKRQQLNSWLRLTIVADQCQHRVSQTLLPTAQLNTNGRRSLRVYRKKINMRWNPSARHPNQGSSFKKVPKLCIGFSPPAAGVLASTWNSFKHSKIGSLFSFSVMIDLNPFANFNLLFRGSCSQISDQNGNRNFTTGQRLGIEQDGVQMAEDSRRTKICYLTSTENLPVQLVCEGS